MKKQTFQAHRENYPEMIVFVKEIIESSNLNRKKKKNFELALEEALINIVNYAYPEESGSIEIEGFCKDDGEFVTFTIKDSGIEFNPFNGKEHEPPQSLDDVEPGNLGIFLIKKLCDEYSYEYIDGKNSIVLSMRSIPQS